MKRVLIFVGALALSGAPAASAQPAATATSLVSTRFSITVPSDEAELVVDGQTIPGAGAFRNINTRPLPPASTQRATFTVTWNPNTYTTMTRTRTVTYRAGDTVTIDLSLDDPADRVRVIYVPTPEDVAQEMVRLAGVRPDDVVFEPGCGDARITIAAVKAGARRGVGIDIDPERVRESRAAVKAAGLSDRIEIRQGDALDIPDLGKATVVLLYMGDHFNVLLRPHLWRQLPVGARVVSHRFKMGDWEPDKTITVGDGLYELHLWTITEAVKRRLN